MNSMSKYRAHMNIYAMSVEIAGGSRDFAGEE